MVVGDCMTCRKPDAAFIELHLEFTNNIHVFLVPDGEIEVEVFLWAILPKRDVVMFPSHILPNRVDVFEVKLNNCLLHYCVTVDINIGTNG